MRATDGLRSRGQIVAMSAQERRTPAGAALGTHRAFGRDRL
jgi:hypothetical protein